MQVWWRTHLSFWHYINGRYDESTKVTGKRARSPSATGSRLTCSRSTMRRPRRSSAKATTRPRGRTSTRWSGGSRRAGGWTGRIFHSSCARCSSSAWGSYAAAVRDAERALALGKETGLPSLQMPHFLARLAHSRLAAGDRTRRHGGARRGDRRSPDDERATFEHTRELVQIGFDIEAGRRGTPRRSDWPRCSPDYRARAQTVFLRNRPDLAARLLEFALEHGIEPDYARTLIEKNALAAPPDAGPAWPFRLRVRALGGFELIRDGAADALHRQGAAAAARSPEAPGRARRQRRRQPAC